MALNIVLVLIKFLLLYLFCFKYAFPTDSFNVDSVEDSFVPITIFLLLNLASCGFFSFFELAKNYKHLAKYGPAFSRNKTPAKN